METRIVIATMVVAGFLLLVAGAGRASEFDRAMEPILTEYLKIQTALAADETQGVAASVGAIAELAKQLDPEAANAGHAEHYANIPQDLLAACAKLQKAKEIGSIRDAFKDLSKPVSMWVTMAKPKGASVMYCPMAKAGWVQHGNEVANPYFGAAMLRCGEKVGGAGSETPDKIGFTDVKTQTAEFIGYYRSIRLTPEQEKIKKEALSALPAPCCSDNTAYSCCCPCNMAKANWGLSHYLIAKLGYDAAQVRRVLLDWIRFINPNGFSGAACYERGGCMRAFEHDGCGGMDESQIRF